MGHENQGSRFFGDHGKTTASGIITGSRRSGIMAGMHRGVSTGEVKGCPTVEDLQVALMLSWREIEHGRERYFLLTRSEALLKEQEEPTTLKHPLWLPGATVGDLFQDLAKREGVNLLDRSKPERQRGQVDNDDMTELGFQKAQEKQPEGNPRRLHDVTEEEFVAEAAEAHENVLNEVLELREEAATLRRRIVAAVHARDKQHVAELDAATLWPWEQLEGVIQAQLPVRVSPAVSDTAQAPVNP